ncbi:hypothetical protein J2X06_000490 [Lysobacter niastensis]|uniref:Uncharacterized protein n=1 Tax=Lysobacter niastensis TaxID=380629 RepID=A0ABU1W6W3_9GAMM|nr:hypothetical protein [Lysobacter niastensis]MDR7133306.1 hypothetical protein [Lysobacter niastensis]
MKSLLCASALLAAGAVALAHDGTPVRDAPPDTVYVNGHDALKRLSIAASNESAVVHGKGQYPAAEKACLDAVAKKTGVHRDKLKITDVSWAQAGVGVTVKVPGAEAPWSCLANQKGRVQGVSYTGNEGRL